MSDIWVPLQFDDKVVLVMRQTFANDEGCLFHVLFGNEADDDEEDSRCSVRGQHASASSSPASGSNTNAAESSPVSVVNNDSAMSIRRTLFRNKAHPNAPYVFDRPWKYVEPVLNFLRTGELVIDPSVNPRGVLLEAQYFNVAEVIKILSSHEPPKLEEKHRDDPVAKRRVTRAELERVLMGVQTNPKEPGMKLRFAGLNLDDVDLSELDLSQCDFTLSSMDRCKFVSCNLTGAILSRCSARNADFTKATMVNVFAEDADFTDVDFSYANCAGSSMKRSQLLKAKCELTNFTNAQLDGVNMSFSVLRGTILRGATLSSANLSGVERVGTSLTMGGVIA